MTDRRRLQVPRDPGRVGAWAPYGATFVALASVLLAACEDHAHDDPASDIAALRIEVDQLAAAVSDRFLADPVVPSLLADSGDVVVHADIDLVQGMLLAGMDAYLDSVSLHLETSIEVGDEGKISKSLGLFSIPIGSWAVRIVIERINAKLRAEPAQLAVSDSNRLDLRIPVHVGDATGQARVIFQWDAALVPGLLCGDFELDESFAGYVEPAVYDLVGYFEFRTRENELIAAPVQTRQISVSPAPGPEGWARVRALLDEKDGVTECGLGMDPEDVEQQLRDLLSRGFSFTLPESLLRPISAPVGVRRAVTTGERTHELEAQPLGLRLTAEALEYSVAVSIVEPGGRDSP